MSRAPVSPARTILWLLALGALWADALHSGLADSMAGGSSERALWIAALAALGGRFVAQAIETGAYVAAGRLFETRIRFGSLFVALFSLSMLDAMGLALVRWNAGAPAPAWLAALVGIRVVPEALARFPGLRMALAGAGVLATLRVAGTIWALVQHGMRPRPAFAAVLAAWTAGRLATWWMTDLARGMSPLP